jgi:hypothetical protein
VLRLWHHAGMGGSEPVCLGAPFGWLVLLQYPVANPKQQQCCKLEAMQTAAKIYHAVVKLEVWLRYGTTVVTEWYFRLLKSLVKLWPISGCGSAVVKVTAVELE